MTYEAKERSLQDGKPISLYTLKWGNTVWRYTSADKDIPQVENAIAVTYLAVPISDDGMTQGGNSYNDMTVRGAHDLPIADLFRSTPPSETIWLTVRRIHDGDPESVIHWVGTVANVKRVDLSQISIICKSLLASFKRSGLRLTWSRGCPHFLYDQSCRVNPVTFERTAEIVSMNGLEVEVDFTGADPTLGYFNGGFLSWVVNGDGTVDRRAIQKGLTATRFKLLGGTDRLSVGLSIKMYPGCDLTAATCNGKFNNLPNFGGFEQMSGKSPFDGTPVF